MVEGPVPISRGVETRTPDPAPQVCGTVSHLNDIGVVLSLLMRIRGNLERVVYYFKKGPFLPKDQPLALG